MQNNREGFTLLEMLIVISIIGIISTMAILGYTQYRRSALIELSVDSFISQVDEIRSDVFYGTIAATDENSTLSCSGFAFENGKIVMFSQEFTGKKVWDETLGNWVYLGCGDYNNRTVKAFELDTDININEGVDGSLNTFVMRFSPPDALVEVSFDSGLNFKKMRRGEFSFFMRYGESDVNVRKVIINLVNGKVNS